MKWTQWTAGLAAALALGGRTVQGQQVPNAPETARPQRVEAYAAFDDLRTTPSLPTNNPKGGWPLEPNPLPPRPALSGPLTLAQCEELAQTYSPILPRDLARVDEARGQALQASIFPNPRMDSNNPQVSNGRASVYNVGIQQEIPVAGKKRLDTAASEQQVRQAELTFHQDRFTLLSNVRKQFYATLAAKRRVENYHELAKVVAESLKQTEKLAEAGQGAPIDTLLNKYDYLQIETQYRGAQTVFAGQMKQLAATVSVGEVEKADVQGDLNARLPVFSEEFIRRYATEGHTQIRIQRSVITQNQIQLKRAQVDPIPNPTIGPAYQFGVVPGQDQFWMTCTFAIPVWDRNQGNIRTARAQVRDAQKSLQQMQNDQLFTLADALSRYQAGRQKVQQYEKEIVPLLNLALQKVKEGRAAGVFDFPRFLTTQRTVVAARADYIDALDAVWAAAADVTAILQLERFPYEQK